MENRRLDTLFSGKTYEILYVLPVMWLGWECDSEAYLVKVGEAVQLVTTVHGVPQLETQESAAEWLDTRIEEYVNILRETSLVRERLNATAPP
jgi:hypothetical protein